MTPSGPLSDDIWFMAHVTMSHHWPQESCAIYSCTARDWLSHMSHEGDVISKGPAGDTGAPAVPGDVSAG